MMTLPTAPASWSLRLHTRWDIPPTVLARQLRRQQTDTIGYILPTEKPQFADAFYSEFIAGFGRSLLRELTLI